MLKALHRLTGEMYHVKGILTPTDYRRWRMNLLTRLPSVLERRSLGPVDEAFGDTFAIRKNGRLLRLQRTSFGVVREIFGQECYCPAAELGSCRQILDLGANAGVFGLFALMAAPDATVHMVEAQAALLAVLQGNVGRNGYADRVRTENALVGGAQNDWATQLRQQNPALPDFSIRTYLDGVGECDFLKCDIEGAEYTFFSGEVGWLRQVRRLALEYHGTWEQGSALGRILDKNGFEVRQANHGALGYLFATRK